MIFVYKISCYLSFHSEKLMLVIISVTIQSLTFPVCVIFMIILQKVFEENLGDCFAAISAR
jgi:hypothetical protein